MTSSPAVYVRDGGIATITLDDGKRNALSPTVLASLGDAFDRAEADGVVVILTGREQVFSAGFDLRVLKRGKLDAIRMLRMGFELAERILAFPRPVVMAVNGHAIAMGAFLVLSGDHRVGADGPFKLVTNEVAIGLTMPRAGVELCRQRLAPAHLTRAAILAEPYTPTEAVAAGFLDEVVPPGELTAAARDAAERFAALDVGAHAGTKRRARAPALRAIRAARKRDMADFVGMGAQQIVGRLTGGR